MTTQTIRHDGRLYRLAYIMRSDDQKPSGQVNGCDVMWLAAGNAMFCGCIGIVCLFIVGCCLAMLGYIAYLLYLAAPYVINWITRPRLPNITYTPSDIRFFEFMGVWFGLVIIIFLIVSARKTETMRLIKAWLRAKKERYCPMWEVV